jgi:hypothetical protein
MMVDVLLGAVACVFLLVVFVVLLSFKPPVRNEEELIHLYLEEAIQYMPLLAENVKILGNDWFTFELQVSGCTRVFLFKHGDKGDCITEISWSEG